VINVVLVDYYCANLKPALPKNRQNPQKQQFWTTPERQNF
jgi:hypothetical protein